MATIAHLAFATAVRRRWGNQKNYFLLLLFLCFLSYFPDLDTHFGLEDSHPWGHRGATHSILFTVVLGAFSGCLGKYFDLSFKKMFWISVMTISHSILDMMTQGNLGVAALWPWTHERYFLPWKWIPKNKWMETLYFSPLLIYSLIPKFKN